jgi:hypothetical protein
MYYHVLNAVSENFTLSNTPFRLTGIASMSCFTKQ